MSFIWRSHHLRETKAPSRWWVNFWRNNLIGATEPCDCTMPHTYTVHLALWWQTAPPYDERMAKLNAEIAEIEVLASEGFVSGLLERSGSIQTGNPWRVLPVPCDVHDDTCSLMLHDGSWDMPI